MRNLFIPVGGKGTHKHRLYTVFHCTQECFWPPFRGCLLCFRICGANEVWKQRPLRISNCFISASLDLPDQLISPYSTNGSFLLRCSHLPWIGWNKRWWENFPASTGISSASLQLFTLKLQVSWEKNVSMSKAPSSTSTFHLSQLNLASTSGTT